MGGAKGWLASGRAAHIAAVVVILLAGALSTAWAFIVPIFQAPDEPAHFDYAVSIFSAGRPIRASDGPTDWIASPYTRYLMRAADFDRIMEHSSMRVPKGYGTPEYFRRIDAAAPQVRPPIGTNRRISYIVPAYPFGFYALEGAVMKAVAVTTGSLVAMFYSARLLCVFLAMMGLYFSYRTVLNLGLHPWLSVALVAVAGFFPLTTFVSSYIQPDNLAFALVSATLFFATGLCGYEIRAPVIIGLGSTVGLLSITKYQFFVSAAIPVLFLAAVGMQRCRASRRLVVTVLGALVIPAIILLGFQRWVSADPVTRQATGILTPLRTVWAAGAVPTIGYVAQTSLRAVVDFFVTGGSAATYWGVLGWVDTPLVIINNNVELVVRIIIASFSLITFSAISYLVVRNALRLTIMAIRGKTGQAISIAARDPVFNSYLCFVLLMLVLYVVTGNAFGAEGRHWYPYVFASFLCFVWYGPKAFLSSSKIITICLTLMLLSYALVSSAYATRDILTRYYGPQGDDYARLEVRGFQIVPQQATGTLWPVDFTHYHVSGGVPPTRFRLGARLRVTGVALTGWGTEVPKVSVVLDHSRPLPTLSGQYNYLAAEATRSISMGYGGFEALIDTRGLREGAHVVSAYVRTQGGRYEKVMPARIFEIERER